MAKEIKPRRRRVPRKLGPARAYRASGGPASGDRVFLRTTSTLVFCVGPFVGFYEGGRWNEANTHTAHA